MLSRAKNAAKRAMIERLRAVERERRRELPSEFGGLPPSLWGWEAGTDGQMRLLGHDAAGLARRFGTPLHVVSLPLLERTHDEFLRLGIRLPYGKVMLRQKNTPR